MNLPRALFYDRAAPVSVERHSLWCMRERTGFDFASAAHCVPLMAVEFPKAAGEYAIVFVEQGVNVVPVVLLGLRTGQNSYLHGASEWSARYVPAFVRRYPFVFSRSDAPAGCVLCLDEDYPGFNTDGEGDPLFTEQGKPAPLLVQALDFLKEYERQDQLTRAFCSELKRLALLTPMQANIASLDGQTRTVAGFQVVDRARLKALTGAELSTLANQNVLELVFAHLISLERLSSLLERESSRTVAARQSDLT